MMIYIIRQSRACWPSSRRSRSRSRARAARAPVSEGARMRATSWCSAVHADLHKQLGSGKRTLPGASAAAVRAGKMHRPQAGWAPSRGQGIQQHARLDCPHRHSQRRAAIRPAGPLRAAVPLAKGRLYDALQLTSATTATMAHTTITTAYAWWLQPSLSASASETRERPSVAKPCMTVPKWALRELYELVVTADNGTQMNDNIVFLKIYKCMLFQCFVMISSSNNAWKSVATPLNQVNVINANGPSCVQRCECRPGYHPQTN